MKKILFTLTCLLCLSLPQTANAQQYKCAYNSLNGSCQPCTNFGSMGECQSSFNINVCNDNLNPCAGAACADNGSGLSSQAAKTCNAAPPPVPVQIPCDVTNAGEGYSCRATSEVISGGYICQGAMSASNAFNVWCDANVQPGYKCCKPESGAPPPGAPAATIGDQFCNINGQNGVKTGLGCLDITGKNTIQTLLNWGVTIGGGVAFIMILIASIQITTAQGDAKRVAAGKELLFATLGGIFLFATAIILLNFIGVNILGLNQFGFKTN